MRFLLYVILTVIIQVVFSSEWNFTRCPEPCGCYMEGNLNIMDCSNSWLEQFPQPETIPSDVQLINVSHNTIHYIPDTYKFWFPEAVELDISHNKLEAVPNFEGFYHLKRLHLGYNRIRNIPEEAFAHSNFLEELNLAHNQVSDISETAFKNLYSLRKLILSWNKLEALPPSVDIHDLRELYMDDNSIESVSPPFLDLPHLQTLSLADNKIFHMEAASLEKCQKLEILNLAHNRFPEVPKQILHAVAATLAKLNLSSTPIAAIRTDDFSNLLAVQEIDLSNTKITVVEESSFRNLPELLQLHLNDNLELKYINYGAFRLLPSLSVLHLHSCSLSGLHDLTRDLPTLQQLTVHGNPLLCDCNLKWLQRSSNTVLRNEQLACYTGNTEQPLQSLNLSTFKTPEKCSPRIIGLPTRIAVVEGQRLILSCEALGNPKPAIQWRNPGNANVFEGQYVMFEKISQSESGTYRCLAYSEVGLAEAEVFVDVVPRLRIELLYGNPTTALIIWSGKLPAIASKLRVRFRNNLTEIVQDAVVFQNRAIVPFYEIEFLYNVELCLLDGTKELICDVWHNVPDKLCIKTVLTVVYAIIVTALFVVLWTCATRGDFAFCCLDALTEVAVTNAEKEQKKDQQNGKMKRKEEKREEITSGMEANFFKTASSSASAVEILSRSRTVI